MFHTFPKQRSSQGAASWPDSFLGRPSAQMLTVVWSRAPGSWKVSSVLPCSPPGHWALGLTLGTRHHQTHPTSATFPSSCDCPYHGIWVPTCSSVIQPCHGDTPLGLYLLCVGGVGVGGDMGHSQWCSGLTSSWLFTQVSHPVGMQS